MERVVIDLPESQGVRGGMATRYNDSWIVDEYKCPSAGFNRILDELSSPRFR